LGGFFLGHSETDDGQKRHGGNEDYEGSHGESPFSWNSRILVSDESQAKTKADVIKRPRAFHYVGLLSNEPPGTPELPFI
jgi:hypothetical protein